MNRDEELEAVLRIARKAAQLVRSIYETPFVVELKGPGDPVTRADREANDVICRQLGEAFPDAAIIAEESAPTERAVIAAMVRKERVFYVDPLDGTREFADRNGEFAVMIGLAVEGRARLGVVVMPTTGEALVGRAGFDPVAFIEDASGGRTSLCVSAEGDPKKATIMISRSHRPKLIEPLTRALGIRRIIPCGSVGVKVARVATAASDLYVHGGGGVKRWDTCAPDAVLVAAGGRFTDLSGASIDYASPELLLKNGIIASNGALHDAVVAAIRSIRPPVG